MKVFTVGVHGRLVDLQGLRLIFMASPPSGGLALIQGCIHQNSISQGMENLMIEEISIGLE